MLAPEGDECWTRGRGVLGEPEGEEGWVIVGTALIWSFHDLCLPFLLLVLLLLFSLHLLLLPPSPALLLLSSLHQQCKTKATRCKTRRTKAGASEQTPSGATKDSAKWRFTHDEPLNTPYLC